MTKQEKAEKQLMELIEAVQTGNFWASDFCDFLLKNLNSKAINGLAEDWELNNENNE
jgi:hypothetical protein